MSDPPYRLYVKQLRHLQHGYALFEPNPGADYDRVRVGDVGHVYMGKFMRLFNIFETGDGPINSTGIPNAFRPLILSVSRISTLESLAPGVYTSASVRRVGGNLELSG